MEINTIVLSGNLVHKPEYRITSNDTKISSFRLASNRGSKEKRTTVFINVVTFNKLAETCHTYLDKGDSVVVQGRLQMKTGNDNINYYEVVADDVKFIKIKKDIVTSGIARTEDNLPEIGVDAITETNSESEVVFEDMKEEK